MAKRLQFSSLRETRKNIVIVDAHPMTREGLRAVINREPDLLVCGEAANAAQAMNVIQQLAPDLVLLEIDLPGRSGLELVQDIKAQHPQLPILVVSRHEEALFTDLLLHAGADGYISKQQLTAELVKAIRRVLDNRLYLSPATSERFLHRFSGKPHANQSPLKLLTDRESEIYELLGKAKQPKEIARQLHLSVKTVAVHNSNIQRKLQLKSTAQLIRYAVQSEVWRSAGQPLYPPCLEQLPATELDFAVRGKVSVWIGNFDSEDALLGYIESKAGFGSDFGCVLLYRRELAVQAYPKPVRELLRGCSMSHRFGAEIAARVGVEVCARCAVVCYASDYSLLGITPKPEARLTFAGVASFEASLNC